MVDYASPYFHKKQKLIHQQQQQQQQQAEIESPNTLRRRKLWEKSTKSSLDLKIRMIKAKNDVSTTPLDQSIDI